MKEYDFILKFYLPDGDADPEQYLDALYKAGCDDATIGIGQSGRVALNFIRKANAPVEAITSAIRDVKKAIQDAKLIEASHGSYRVTWSPEDCEYVGLCAEFPSLSWLAKSPEEALVGIRKVVAKVGQDIRADLP